MSTESKQGQIGMIQTVEKFVRYRDYYELAGCSLRVQTKMDEEIKIEAGPGMEILRTERVPLSIRDARYREVEILNISVIRASGESSHKLKQPLTSVEITAGDLR